MRKRWNAEIVIREVQRLHRAGKPLNHTWVQRYRRSLIWAAYKYHGSWRAAVVAAGINYTDQCLLVHQFRWDATVVVQLILDRKAKGLPLNSNFVQQHEHGLYAAAVRYHGGWRQAIVAAGLSYFSVRKRLLSSWSQDRVIAEILKRVRYQLSIGGDAVSREDRGLYQAAQRYFGRRGWAKARVVAGFTPIDPRPWKIWNEQKVIAEILRLHRSGIALNTGAICRGEYGYIHAAGIKVFGTWGQAVSSAGLSYVEIRKAAARGWWTRERVLTGISSLEHAGIRLSSQSIQRSHGDLFGAALKFFGAWSVAVEAAGFNYRAHTQRWSSKAWIHRLKTDDLTNIESTIAEKAKIRRTSNEAKREIPKRSHQRSRRRNRAHSQVL